MLIKKYWTFETHYSQLGEKPNVLQLLIVLSLKVLFDKKRDINELKRTIRAWRAFRADEILDLNCTKVPSIELLSVVAGKDIEMLLDCIEMAVLNSKNPVSRINVVTPEKDMKNCEGTLKKLSEKYSIQIINEDSLISETTRNSLLNKFKDRYGWVLQQLLADHVILNSKSKGVLLINSDTVILNPVQWLCNSGNQILMISTSNHRPYYEMLNKLIGTRIRPKTTHVTHHMLFQPELFREIFEKYRIIDVENLANLVIARTDDNEESPLCIEFELYAQAMLKLYPDKVSLRKFSNLEVARNQKSLQMITDAKNKFYKPRYNSISVHSYSTE
jgi:hypothetical protein